MNAIIPASALAQAEAHVLELERQLPISLVERVNMALARQESAAPDRLRPYLRYTRKVRFWCDALEGYGHQNRSDPLFKAMKQEFERELDSLWK